MITRKTTLILGAGASKEVGYPLGKELRDNVLALVKSHLDQNKPSEIAILNDLAKIREFHDRLAREGYQSVDAFLERRPEFIALGKFFMAKELKLREIPDGLFPARGWYEHLVQSLFSDVHSPDEFKKNQISIVTYNYDRTVDHLLHETARLKFDLTVDDAWALIRSTIPIVHVHGILGNYPDIPYQREASDSELLALSDHITIIHEVKTGFETLTEADSLLFSSEYLYILGFSMSDSNMNRLNYFSDGIHQRVTPHLWCAVGNLYSFERSRLGQRLNKFNIPPNCIYGNAAGELFRSVTRLDDEAVEGPQVSLLG